MPLLYVLYAKQGEVKKYSYLDNYNQSYKNLLLRIVVLIPFIFTENDFTFK